MTALADLRAIIAAMPGALTVQFGAFSAPCIVEFNGQQWPGGDTAGISQTTREMRYPYDDLPGLVPGSTVTIAAKSYQVTSGPVQVGDGLEAYVYLEAL